jgi:hypothetical protein
MIDLGNFHEHKDQLNVEYIKDNKTYHVSFDKKSDEVAGVTNAHEINTLYMKIQVNIKIFVVRMIYYLFFSRITCQHRSN